MSKHRDTSIAQSEKNVTPLSRVTYLDASAYQVDIYADMAQLRRVSDDPLPRSGGGIRSSIATFSKASRSRMFRWLASVRNVGQLHFITLTYRDEEWFGDDLTPDDFQRHLEAFYRRVERNYDDVGILWRKEMKRRKSGDNAGRVAPHAHCIIRNMGDDLDEIREFVRTAWSEITGSSAKGDETRTDVQIARSRRKMASYLSKYTAKLDDSDDISNLTDSITGVITQWGRHWGYRGSWDTSLGDEITVSGREVIEFKRLIRRWLKSQGKKGFAQQIARISFSHGVTILGLGDESGGDGALIVKLLRHCSEIAEAPP